MKKLLLPFILLSTIPFNASCIKDITFEVTISAEHCEYKVDSKIATRGHDYVVTITSIEDGYMLEQYVDYFWIKTSKFDPIYPGEEQWSYSDNKLVIYGSVVAVSLDIKITALPKEE